MNFEGARADEELAGRYIPGLETDPAMVAKYQATLERKMEGYDLLLGRQKFMAGDVSLSSRP